MNNTVILSNGVEMPHLGLGTYPMRGRVLTSAVLNAYQFGYRLIDTADNYYNEEDLGHSLRVLYEKTAAKREEMFLISKVSDELYEPGTIGGGLNKGKFFWKSSPVMQQPDAVRQVVRMKLNETLHNLGTDYLDLYLMHWPYPDFFEEIWFEMEQVYQEGKVRAIGVCNSRERHFEKLGKSCRVFPMVNQFETSPINTKVSLIGYCESHNVKVMVYSPLMSLRRNEIIGYQSYVNSLAEKYHRNAAQINLRFDVQRGLIPIPKSSHAGRLKANISVFDFSLTQEEMEKLFSFNVDYQTLPESKACPGL